MLSRFFKRSYRPVIHPKEITALFDPVHHVVMDWSPKVGCTVLTKMFFRQMGLLEEALAWHSWVHEYRMHVFSKKQPTRLEDILSPANYTFKVVRNPYLRAVSAYVHTMKKEVMHAPVAGVLRTKDADISFRQFVDFLSKSDLLTCDPHYALQKKYFEFEHPGCFKKIVHLEKLEEGIREVNAEGHQHFDLSGLTSHHHTEVTDDPGYDVSDLKWSRIANSIPPHHAFLNPELTQVLFALYRDDFEDYGYAAELPQR